ncbi:MAG TPA: DNA replication and repair protein RecF [Pyrinomonadaceae bacterium]|nr:DNA replication and repair protein RecF [Pyrinomonadaceae bacterium]
MILESIRAHHFRNLSGELHLGPRLNIILGSNGQGKTNWLEAIYLLSRSKSFRTQRLQEAIKFGQESAFVRGRVASGAEVSRDLQVSLQGTTKSISVNGKKESLARYVGQLQVFSFTAAELEVVRGVPEARRRFIDRGVASLQPSYVQTVTDYNRVLKQKNRILQDANEQNSSLSTVEDLIAPWNEQLAALASVIHQARANYVDRINEVLERGLFEQRDVHINYVSALAGKGDLSDYRLLMSQRLGLRLPAELAAGRSLIGPHRDDLEVLLDGREMKVFGSSGQQRSALLILDLAAISLYNSWHGDYPLFLIDDVDAELDERRIGQLLEYLESRTQTFITTSKQNHLESFLSKASVYEIADGSVLRNRQAEQILAPLETT